MASPPNPPLPKPCQSPLAPLESHVGRALVRDVLCGACACTPSIQSQLLDFGQQRACGGKLSMASIAVGVAPAPHSAVGADGAHLYRQKSRGLHPAPS